MKISELRREFFGHLDSYQEERMILSFVLKKTEEELILDGFVSDEEVEKVRNTLRLRKEGIPLAYIFGEQEFYGRKFTVNENVLIPREETSALVKRGIELKPSKVLDLCTGSGILAISLALETKGKVTGSDVSSLALEVAKENAQRLGAEVHWIESDLFDKITGRYDLIVSNPPYIDTQVLKTLEVSKYEPKLALDGGKEGLDFYKAIIREGRDYLTPGGTILLEIGYDQWESVQDMAKNSNYDSITVKRDLAGYHRMVELQVWE